MEFLSKLFESSRFTPRGETGGWTPALAWLHITCDLLIWIAFMAIAVMLVYLARRRRDLPFISIIVMFGAFIIACGFTHFMEVMMFSAPMYRCSGLLKVITALLSWAAVIALIPLLPKALVLRSPHELEREIAQRRRVEHELLRQTDSLKEQAKLLDLAHETILVRDMTGTIT